LANTNEMPPQAVARHVSDSAAKNCGISDDRIISKAARRIIPLLLLLYFFSFLDRINISFAALQMNADLGFSNTVYGVAAGLFFLGYFCFQIPSNLLLAKFGARRWIAVIAVSWGLVSTCMALISSAQHLYLLRLLLGITEAGFFPGIVVYLGGWFPRHIRASVTGLFMLAVPLTGLFGNPISGLLLDHLNGLGGMAGWKWMFVLEGIPAAVLGVLCLWLLPSIPKEASWLTAYEKARLGNLLDQERQGIEAIHRYKVTETFTDCGVLLLGGTLFSVVFCITGLGFFLPQIIKSFGYTNTYVGFLSAVPYLCAAVGTIYWSRRSDRKSERVLHIAAATLTAALGFLIATLSLHIPTLAMIGIVIAAAGIFASNPLIWALPTSAITGTSAAAAVAFINTLASASGALAPILIGWSYEASGGFVLAGSICTGALLVGTALILLFSRTKLARGMDPVTRAVPP